MMIAAGCGGDDDGGDAAAPASTAATGSEGGDEGEAPPALAASSLSRAQYVQRANALCARAQKARQRAAADYQRDEDVDEVESFVAVLREVYAPTLAEQAADLRALGSPRGGEEQVEAILASMEATAEALGRLREIPDVALDRAAVRAERLARAYGLDTCAAETAS